MEEAPGISVADIWKDIGLESKDRIIDALVAIENKLLSVAFTRLVRYGNVYFARDSFPGCEKAEISSSSSLPLELKMEVEERFTIGPVVEHVFWKEDRASMPIERGLWKTAQDYLKALENNQYNQTRQNQSWLTIFAPSFFLVGARNGTSMKQKTLA
ncbi:uncharacterized protein BP5553_05903 [Venustampulla echinocandica]|uniref:Uncharacterized protein n=1 Tax=Venustampulla echinocandica TaxID=2656787 RepID=A0A370TLZ6_9HELO|nr:uncharacterized protein BP5553_05903 [Venustampulla echinocandica]RDL36551.1 hypothetical protein BP5553_05903 [Venustampulla echinocandica]